MTRVVVKEKNGGNEDFVREDKWINSTIEGCKVSWLYDKKRAYSFNGLETPPR